jgi:hypothetical protein
MSKYESQLKGWAVDRVIEAVKVGALQADNLAAITKHADELAKYAFVPQENLVSIAKEFYEAVRNAPDGEAHIEEIEFSIAAIKAEREQAGLDKPQTSN